MKEATKSFHPKKQISNFHNIYHLKGTAVSHNIYDLSVPLHRDITIFFIHSNPTLFYNTCPICCCRFNRFIWSVLRIELSACYHDFTYYYTQGSCNNHIIFISLSPNSHLNVAVLQSNQVKGKGKAVPLQAQSGPEGSRKLSFPDFMTTAQDGGKVVSLMHRPPLPPRNAPGTHFC